MQLIVKSSGVEQEFNPEKIMNVIRFSIRNEDIDPYSLYEPLTAVLKNSMSTKDIQSELIRIASGLISKEAPEYQYPAARLKMFALRKQVYGQFEPISFIEHISNNVNEGVYDPEILSKWSAEEIAILESHIVNDRDFEFSYAGVSQLIDKYMIKDRSTGKIYETPQYAFMLIGMCLHQDDNDRIKHTIEFYDAVSNKQISLPTPIMAGVRTPTRQFSSCVVIEGGDSLHSINKLNESIVKYISKRAGVGMNAGMIRAQGSKVRSGEVAHTGVIPFWKMFQAAVKSCSQGGIRGGAATLYYPLWHLEYENLIVLKNNKGTEETRSRHLDYGIQINDLMIKRFIKNDYITLFSPDAHPELYSAYFEDSEKFTKIYEALEKDPKVRKKRIRATEAFTLFMGERANTARIYPMFVDNVNEHGPFVRDIAPVKQSNLCIDGDALVNIRVGTNEDESTLKMKHLVKFFNSSSKDVFVESWDTIKNKRVWNKVKAAALMNPDAKVLKITGKGFDISTTPDHKFFTKDKGWLEAEFIDSQEVLNIKGKWVKANVRDDDEYIEVFDITVENSHCFFANNVLVHNCAEIALPTRDVGSDDPLVNLCTLSAFVLDSFDYQDQETIDRLSRIMVRALDNLLDYQEYPIAEALPSKRMRSLGVGVTNYAGWLASNYLSYRDSEEFTHELFERLQYSLIKASVGLAKEKGAAEDLAVSKYGQGLLPIDWYNKNVDELVAPNYVCDWESLRVDLKQYGIRNLTLTALMPCESSSQVSNSTNGIEPPRSAVTVKLSKDGAFRQVVPNIQELDDVYDYAWKLAKFGNKHYLKNVAIMQKFVDQSISANTYYIPHMFLKGKVPMSIMLDDLLYAWRFNVKTMYYHNTHDGSEDSSEDTPDDSDCAACKL